MLNTPRRERLTSCFAAIARLFHRSSFLRFNYLEDFISSARDAADLTMINLLTSHQQSFTFPTLTVENMPLTQVKKGKSPPWERE
ncbi:hypothetical protein V2G26_014988 [Clonostachys chloroleuca]